MRWALPSWPDFGQSITEVCGSWWHAVIWRAQRLFASIGNVRKNLSGISRKFPPRDSRASDPVREVRAVIYDWSPPESFEISPRFRQSIEERIARLERDADLDEAQVASLENADHIRRQLRLVAAERAEAMRMRVFLDRATTRPPHRLIAR
jgi:hypothetical protein